MMQSASDIFTSFFGAKGNSDDRESRVIGQFVHRVEDFSSQYGSEISVSYTAFNLRGPPSNFPFYGDYPQAFVMRTYGTWWEEAPSATKAYVPQNSGPISSQDFVEVSFEKAVYPANISVFETYNPGALVRVWAKGAATWSLLWEGEPEYVGDTPRIFCPPIRRINEPIRILRLEFNHRLLPYYTELDAVLLCGREPVNKFRKKEVSYPLYYKNYTILPAAEKGEKTPTPKVVSSDSDGYPTRPGSLLNRVLSTNLHQTVGPPLDLPVPEAHCGFPLGDFQRLPDETILCVFRYLDMASLCRCARVSRHFRRLANDAVLYRCLDLRPYWSSIHDQVLMTLSARCKQLQKLDLSWCGGYGMIHSHYIVSFLRECGAELTHLRMNCCKFVDDSVLRAVVDICGNLQELCLRSVVRLTEWGCLSRLTRLRRLDLYRADVGTAAVVATVRANPQLQHLNLGSCKMIAAMDEVAIALGDTCPDLVSVDFWKSYSLTSTGLHALGNCRKIQELDVGWCLQAGGSGEWLSWLSGGQLRKLFMGALRGVGGEELRRLGRRAPHLTQLDLLGVRALTADVCDAILADCHELQLLDISFCDQIQESQVAEWRARYPQVSIKRSFQSENSLASTPNQLFLAPAFE